MNDVFLEILKQSGRLTKLLIRHKEEIKDILIQYQPINVTQYEIDRCLYTLENVDQLQKYLQKQTSVDISVFMSSNLPLYSLLLFAIVPSFIAGKVILRPNTKLVEQIAVRRLFDVLELQVICPDIEIFSGNKRVFLQNYVAQSDLVIFTGRNKIKDKVKKYMKNGSFMINNGSGHNPIIVAEGADVDMAVKGVLYSRFFNSGQDCTGPDAVFVHESIGEKFIAKLREKVSSLKIGDHSDPDTVIGKIHRKEELKRLQDIIDNNKNKVILGGRVDIQNKVVHPTIVLSDIRCEDLNYDEIFGPILFLYMYQDDDQLQLYFKDKDGKYTQNKMYVSLFGISEYIKFRDDNVLIKERSSVKNGVGRILYNTIMHDFAIDNGFTPYGGYSRGSSSIIHASENFKSVATPILIPEVMYNIFIQKSQIENLIAVNHVVSMEVIEKKKRQKVRREISKEFINLVTETFESNLIFAFIFGSVSNGNFEENKSDMDTFVCLKNTGEQIGCFISDVKALHEKFNLRADNDYPSEIVGYWALLSGIYHLYYQLYGINYSPWLDNQKYDSCFLTEFKCCDSKTYDIVFWAAVIAVSKKIALINRNKELFKKLEEDARELTNNLVEEILKNVITFGLPKALREKYPGLNSQEIVNRLKELNYCDVLRHLEWIPEKDNQSESQSPGETGNKPRALLSDTVSEQLAKPKSQVHE